MAREAPWANPLQKEWSANLPGVDRIEFIDYNAPESGRTKRTRFVDAPLDLYLSVQDDGKTFKVFIKERD